MARKKKATKETTKEIDDLFDTAEKAHGADIKEEE